ncbi:hypothetical protein KNV99_03150 [Acinetobacter nosocomialis]|nr:hypothetical protein KNV99_03150 [Acinetobacter nosocomialis]
MGLNYPEVVLMGYLYISLPVLQFILWSAISITLILCIVFVTFSIRWLQKHKGTKIEYREYIQKSFKRVRICLDKQKKDLIKAINSFLGILGLYFVIFIFTFLLILFYYKLGIKEIEDKVQENF